MDAKAAYDVLSDQGARLRYDETLERTTRTAQRAKQAHQAATQTAPPPGSNGSDAGATPRSNPNWKPPSRQDPARIAVNVQRLTNLFARGRHAEAESLARDLVQDAPRNPVVYAVLGDLARLKGDLNEAAKMYAYAAQFDPHNAVYQRRYEELLSSGRIVEGRNMRMQIQHEDRRVMSMMVGAAVVIACGLYITMSHEHSAFPRVPAISTWTSGLVIALFVSGLGMGITLSRGYMVDRFSSLATTATGKAGPIIPLSIVALANFWVAFLLYLVLGTFQRAFTYSATRLFASVTGALCTLAIASAVVDIEPLQVLLWGGNVAYPGALIGWLLADSFRR